MSDATLTSKSQLTLPKEVREAMGVGPGDRIRFVPSLNGFRIVALKGDISRLQGMFAGRRKSPLSIEDVDRAVGEYLGAKDRRTMSKPRVTRSRP
jgi:AbrB family looped-hinge helix DNA binding protein